MSNVSEVKDARVNLDGDKVACQKWLSFAYSKLAVLWDNYKKTNQISSKAFKPDNETTIICSIKPGGNKWIYIKSGSPNLSTYGIIRSSYIDYSDNTLYEFMQKSPLANKKWKNTSKLATKPSSYYNIPLSGNTSQHKYIKASMFSGIMRKYMQLILGINQEQKFDYRWEKSHLFQFQTFPTTVNSKIEFEVNAAKHQFWLVEIGKDGMYIARSDCYIPKFKSNSDIDSFPFIPQTYEFPSGDALTAAIANKTAYQIYSATEMADFYGNSYSFFKECGWSAGLNADLNGYLGANTGTYTNTCYRQINGVWTSQVWRIGLTITPITGSTTVIISKYKQIAESGRMWSTSPNSGINVPDYDNNCIKTLSFNGFDKPPNGVFNFPIHVCNGLTYYSKSGVGNYNDQRFGDIEVVDLSIGGTLLTKRKDIINNGNIVISESPRQSDANPIINITTNYSETGYVIPMYDRESIFIGGYSYGKNYAYNLDTSSIVSESITYDQQSLSLRKIGSASDADLSYFPIVIQGSSLTNVIINNSNNQNNGIHVEIVSDVFVNRYSDFTYSTPYTNLYRAEINGTIYSWLQNYVNYSAFIISNQGATNVRLDTYPVYGGDDITNFSFVGKP